MALSLHEQVRETVGNSKNILIAFKKNHNPDAIASALALKLLLEKMDKEVSVVSDNFKLDDNLRFLPESHCVETNLEGTKQFKICFDLKHAPLKDFSYDVENDQLNIYITPRHGVVKNEHMQTHEGQYRYDLIITVDTEDLESLGTIFDTNADLFYQTPILNIDHKPENEGFGQINHVDLNATSTAEIVYSLFEELSPDLIDEHISQCLLCGLVAKTKSFKDRRVTPHTLHIASRLMKHGADRDEIVKNLYYTKSINTLKLWGKVLSRLKSEPTQKLAWSFLEQKDFTQLGATPDKLTEVIEELIVTAPEAKIITIFYEYNNQIKGILYSDTGYSSLDLVVNHKPFGSKRLASFTIKADSVLEASKQVMQEIKQKISA